MSMDQVFTQVHRFHIDLNSGMLRTIAGLRSFAVFFWKSFSSWSLYLGHMQIFVRFFDEHYIPHVYSKRLKNRSEKFLRHDISSILILHNTSWIDTSMICNAPKTIVEKRIRISGANRNLFPYYVRTCIQEGNMAYIPRPGRPTTAGESSFNCDGHNRALLYS